ncbi:MAG: hypothetical protein H6755_03690 [Candidatus Omnitrophica bacterium]|nr:hypothetical protein [Candidatus Omnitrophota bacterium]MCB9747491.1 hypothetical protein [Candidatus Omnitrophota bacterium]
MGQKDEKRKKELRRIKEKRDAQQSNQPSSFNFSEYLKTYRLEIVLFCVCLFALGAIKYFAVNKKVWDATRVLTATVDAAMLDQIQEIYPDGYKIMAYAFKKFVPTNYNTMPKSLSIDWNAVQLIRISNDSVTLKIPQISYPSRDIEISEITQSFLRNVFTPTGLYNKNGISFEVQIINQEEDQILFLFGIFDERKARKQEAEKSNLEN